MDEINGTGVIEEINQKEGAKGWFYKLTIGGKTYNTFEKLDAFGQLEDKMFKTGDPVAFDYSEHQSGKTVFKNLIRLRALGAGKKVTTALPQQKLSAPPVNRTGTQIVRMNALTNSMKFFELNKVTPVTEGQVREMAELFEKWVTR